jgi:hypothetical protein
MTKPTMKGRTTIISLLLLFLLAIFSAAPAASAAENDTIQAVHFSSAELVRGVPPGWALDRKTGTANIRLEKAGDAFFVRLVSDRSSSFGIKRELHVDLREFPFLTWQWKAVRLPRGGDVRKAATDDQAVQLYVAFAATGFPAALNTPTIGYIWDNEAPRGWTGRSDQIGGGKLRYLVLRNKADPVGAWYAESRNIQEDFRKLFRDLKGLDAVTYGIQLHINSQYTKSEAEGCIGDVYFSRRDMRGMTASAPFLVVR